MLHANASRYRIILNSLGTTFSFFFAVGNEDVEEGHPHWLSGCNIGSQRWDLRQP